MSDDIDREYLEGKIRGLEIIRDVLINTIAGLQSDLPNEIDLRIRVSNGIDSVVADFLEPPRVVETPFGQGARDALLESKSKFFGE